MVVMNKLIETVARALCERVGSDPDSTDMLGRANWQHPNFVNDARAAIAAIKGTGWQLVPVEPTEEMWPGLLGTNEAEQEAIDAERWDAVIIYKAMLAAAPDPLGDSHD